MFLPSFIYMVPWVLVVQMTWLSPLTLGLLPKNLSWDSPSLTATQGTIYHIFEYTSMHTPIIEQPNTTVMRKTGKNLLHLFTSISFFYKSRVLHFLGYFFAKINVSSFSKLLKSFERDPCFRFFPPLVSNYILQPKMLLWHTNKFIL